MGRTRGDVAIDLGRPRLLDSPGKGGWWDRNQTGGRVLRGLALTSLMTATRGLLRCAILYHVIRWIATAALAVSVAGCATWRGARLYQSGTAALERGQIELALGELSQAARLVPEASEIHNHLGIARLEAGRIELARESFERALELDCDNQAASDNLERVQATLQVSGP